MRVSGIIHLLYKALRELPVCVQSEAAVRVCSQGAVHIRTAGRRKCHLHQSVPHGEVKCHAHFQNRTPSIQCAAGPPSFCTQPVAAVSCMRSGAVQIRTVVVRKCHLHQSSPNGGVNCHAHFRNHTPSIQGAAQPPSLCTQPVAAAQCTWSGTVHIRTAGVRNFRLFQSGPHGGVKCHARFRNHM